MPCGPCVCRSSTGEPESPVPTGSPGEAALAISDDAVAVAACEHAGLLRGEDPVFTNVDAAYRAATGTFVRGFLSGTSYVFFVCVEGCGGLCGVCRTTTTPTPTRTP